MANDKKNIKELVAADDDPTAELEALVLPSEDVDDDSEASATTTGYVKGDSPRETEDEQAPDLEFGNQQHSETVDNLKFELEVLRAKWQGLATEIDAREDQAGRLNHDLEVAQTELQRSKAQIADRDARIQSLEQAVANRDDAYLALADELEKLHQAVAGNNADDFQHRDRLLQEQAGKLAGKLAGSEMENRELRARLDRVETYADQLRYQLRLKIASAGDLGGQLEILEQELAGAKTQIADLQAELDAVTARNTELEDSIRELHSTHAEEIRMIRFELGDAQATLSQHEQVAEELASDLVRTRSQRQELEIELAKAEETSQSRVKALEESNRELRREVDMMREKLRSKSEAVNSLLEELAQNPRRPDSVAEVEEPIHDVGERTDGRGTIDRDRVTRLLTGHIDGQKLRFPLFKDRLTIGRTGQNDIQLKSKHVSRRHAVVVIEGDVTRLIDWGSKNGVFVNSHRVKEHFLKSGDVVAVGTAEFRYEERPKREN